MSGQAFIPPSRQMAPVTLVTPGSRGLNTQVSAGLIDPSYAVYAQNCVVDANGRLAARNGFQDVNSVAVGGQILTTHEFNSGNTNFFQMLAWNGGMGYYLNSASTPSTAQAITALTTSGAPFTYGRWYMQDFNNSLILFQNGQVPQQITATGTTLNAMANAGASWSASSGVGCAAFGRVWSVNASDGQTIQYSGLLSASDTTSTDAGIIDMHTVWQDGTDVVTAIFPFNGALVVCGTKHIVLWTDGRGSSIGIDPTQMYVFDVILGTGCLSQWSVDFVGQGDVVFISPNGLQSLTRLTQNTSNPTQSYSKYVRNALMAQVNSNLKYASISQPANIQNFQIISGCYNPLLGQYFMTLPNTNTTWCFDMRRMYADDVQNVCSVVTNWSATTYCCNTDHWQNTFFSRNSGFLSAYTGYLDEGATYIYQWTSPWMDFSAVEGAQAGQKYKLLKRYSGIVLGAQQQSLTVTWATDFGTTRQQGIALPAGSPPAYFGGPSAPGATAANTPPTKSYFGGVSAPGANAGNTPVPASYFGVGSSLAAFTYDARAKGQYYQIGVSCPVVGQFSLQQVQLDTKLGRTT